MNKNALTIILVLGVAAVGLYLYFTRNTISSPGIFGTGILGTRPNVVNNPTSTAITTGLQSLGNLVSIFDAPLTKTQAPTLAAASSTAPNAPGSVGLLPGFTTADFSDYVSENPPESNTVDAGTADLMAATSPGSDMFAEA